MLGAKGLRFNMSTEKLTLVLLCKQQGSLRRLEGQVTVGSANNSASVREKFERIKGHCECR